MAICLERSADLHMAQLMPLPLTVSCFSKIQIGFTFLVLAHPGSPVQRAVKRVCVLVHVESCGDFLDCITCTDCIDVDVVCLSLCVSVGHNCGPCKTAELIETPSGFWTRMGRRNHALGGGPDSPGEGAVLGGRCPASLRVRCEFGFLHWKGEFFGVVSPLKCIVTA